MSVVYKQWEELIPCHYVLGADGTRDRYYKQCKEHKKLLNKHGFKSDPPPIIVFSKECDYCKLRDSLKMQGQLKEVLLYNDGKTIRGPDGNHRAFVLGIELKQPIECIITDSEIPKTALEWITSISQDDLTKPTDFETIVKWIEELYPIEDVSKIAETVFAYRNNSGPERNIDDVHFIYNTLIPFYKEHPEFRNKIGKPGIFTYGGREKRMEDRIHFAYGKIKDIIKSNNSIEIKALSSLLKEPNLGTKTAFRSRDEKIDKIKSRISKKKRLPPFDSLKIENLQNLLIHNTDITNNEDLKALDLFARKMDETSTTGALLSCGYTVLAIGNEVDWFMIPSKNLTPIETDVYRYLYESENLGEFDWINIDPYGPFSSKIIIDLMKHTTNLTWVISNWRRRTSQKNRGMISRNRLEEFGLYPPKTFREYIDLITNKILTQGHSVKNINLSKGNLMLYIHNIKTVREK